MVKETNNQTKELIKKELKIIKKFYQPSEIFLFGSRARNDCLKSSDVDLLIVSEKFRGEHFLNRGKKIFLHWDKKQGLDLLCYTPEEFARKKEEYGIVRQAVKEGISLL